MRYVFWAFIVVLSLPFHAFTFTSTFTSTSTSLAIQADLASDFKYQGEYIGKGVTQGQALGAQVVATGNGNFTVAFLEGGLPGMGWNRISRTEQSGTWQTDKVRFQALDLAHEYSADIMLDNSPASSSAGAKISGTTPKGESFTLNKIIRRSPTLDSLPPPGPKTFILFNGTDLSAFLNGSAVMDSSHLLPTGSASAGAVTLRSFGSFTLHLEFQVPFMPMSSGQGRGNSGVYLQGRYELQILDSFGLNILRNGPGPAKQECGAFYELVQPSLNMSFPPRSWQTYDVAFRQAKFDAKSKALLEPAVVTVRLNGEVIHQDQKLLSPTLLGDVVNERPGPLRFQAHGDAVRYRNIWIVETEDSSLHSIPRKKLSRPKFSKSTGFLRDEGTSPFWSSITGQKVTGALPWGVYFSKTPNPYQSP